MNKSLSVYGCLWQFKLRLSVQQSSPTVSDENQLVFSSRLSMFSHRAQKIKTSCAAVVEFVWLMEGRELLVY